jgi:hypothetical protein
MFSTSWRQWLFLGLFTLYSFFFFLQQTNLQASDLGRHLTNGREVLSASNFLSADVLSRNYYSYTHPEFEVTNHHWFFGVLAYWGYQLVGFPGLTVINALIAASAIGLVVSLAWLRTRSLSATLLSSFLLLPFATYRTEIRPETVSLLCVAVFYFVLDRYFANRISARWLLLLVPLQMIWVNIHIFFIFGIAFVGLYFLLAILRSLQTKTHPLRAIVHLTLLGAGLLASVTVSPFGWRNLLTPLTILDEYGYSIVENQSTFFLLRVLPSPEHYYFVLLLLFLGVLTGSFFIGWLRANQVQQLLKLPLSTWFQRLPLQSIGDVILSLCFLISAASMVRIYSFFGLVFIPILAGLLTPVVADSGAKVTRLLKNTTALMFISPLGFLILVGIFSSGIFTPQLATFGLGLLPGSNLAAEFYRQVKLSGPVFNNYDIGGYLIYHLYPTEKVFTDNRPEAYPAVFIANDYIAPQEEMSRWQELDERWNFNSIFFYRHDLTPWAQNFMIERVQDDEWAPVYVDHLAIIFVKKIPQNQAIIDTYALDKSLFSY